MPVNRRARAIAVGSVLALTVALFSLEYTVQRGDTLSEIARDHDVSLSDVIELNEISNPDLIRPGQVILIPGVDGSVEQVHVVGKGETLNEIASAYGASASAIAEANSLANPNLILPGQEVLIPTTRKNSPGWAPAPPVLKLQHRTGRARAPRHDPGGSTSFSGRHPGLDRRAVLGRVARHHRRRQRDRQWEVYTGTRLFLDGPPSWHRKWRIG